MTEITQADREAAAAHSRHWGRHAQAANVKRGTADGTFLLRLLAAHREQAERETVARIVAWLRGQHQQLDLLNYGGKFADAIEAGEWKR